MAPKSAEISPMPGVMMLQPLKAWDGERSIARGRSSGAFSNRFPRPKMAACQFAAMRRICPETDRPPNSRRFSDSPQALETPQRILSHKFTSSDSSLRILCSGLLLTPASNLHFLGP